jgi:hypothetical protein
MKQIKRQSGVSLVTAIFLITALAVLAAMASRFLILGSEETINELYSGQALAAAESGVDWAVHDILYSGGSGVTVDSPVTSGTSWFSTSVTSVTIGPKTQYTITSTGEAGGSATNPRVQRQLVVKFMP